jgi:hypothetical protein
VVERFSIDRSSGSPVLRREYVVDDPLYFAGQLRGADSVLVADLPYETPSCTDLSYKTGVGTPAAENESAEVPPAAVKPWWMFWK